MIDMKLINDVAKRFAEMLPPSLQGVKSDLELNFHSMLQNIFAKLDLVTREEFDAQAGVLAKTRAKVEALEQQVITLEKALLHKNDGFE